MHREERLAAYITTVLLKIFLSVAYAIPGLLQTNSAKDQMEFKVAGSSKEN